MMRTRMDWRSASKENYNSFCKKHPSIKISFNDWKSVLYLFNDGFKEYILETGQRAKLPFGFGDFAITKKKRRKMKGIDGKEFVNLPIDWKKTKEKGKRIYNFNFHTEGYFFGWLWFKNTARFRHFGLWYFKPCRNTSRLLSHYIKADEKYQFLYMEWKK